MEEEIKILEERLKDNRKQFEEIGTHIFLNEDLTTITENLIKGYRELEKENKELKEYIFVAPNLDEMTAVKYLNIQKESYVRGRAEEQRKAEQIIYENYIPKSLIKEKIEELNDMIIETHRGNLQRYTVSEILSFIRFCEELLNAKL